MPGIIHFCSILIGSATLQQTVKSTHQLLSPHSRWLHSEAVHRPRRTVPSAQVCHLVVVRRLLLMLLSHESNAFQQEKQPPKIAPPLGIHTPTQWACYNCDSSAIRARYNILQGVKCFWAIMNMSILCVAVGCCSLSAIPRWGFYLYNDVIVTYTVFTCVWRVCSKSIVAAKVTHHEH